MEWNKGFSATYYATIVDGESWRDLQKFDITDGSINKSDSALIESADLTTTYRIDREQWVRIYLDTEQNGAASHVALFTGLAIPPKTDIEGNVTFYSLECYSGLKPAEDVLLQRGYYIPSGINGGTMIQELLKVTPAPVVLDDNAPNLRDVIIAENGENHLTMVRKILKAINWRLRIAGDGTIHVCPKATEADIVFDALENDSIEPKISLNHDWFNCPNVFRAINGDVTAIARDERTDSFLSIPVRGREVWKEETNCKIADNEGLAEYAERRLAEEQSRAYDASYVRRYHPSITIGDYVGLHYPAQGLDGQYKVTSQKITLGYGCSTQETVEYYLKSTETYITT